VTVGKRRARKTDRTSLLARLDELYPDVECALDHRNPFELLVATILSAQCTDKRVNMVTPHLFAAFPTPRAMAAAPLPEIEEIIRSTGFFRSKARNIQACAQRLVEEYDGHVPDAMEDLLSLAGVARKTANVVLGVAFGKALGVVVDTHVKRISALLGLTSEKTPEKIERDLMEILPRDHWIRFSHQIIHLGREVCIANRPRCAACGLAALCPSARP
jgi:endonuclease-3